MFESKTKARYLLRAWPAIFAGLICFLAGCKAQSPSVAGADQAVQSQTRSVRRPSQQVSRNRNQFLAGIEHRSFAYFWDEMDQHNGLIPDRARAAGGGARIASIAAEGFGLTALCIADEHHWEPHAEIYARVLRALDFFRYHAQCMHGFYYHFLALNSGRRQWKCEVSSIDTALLMAGVLTVREHFSGTAASRIAAYLYRRVDWPWMLNGKKTLSMGWKPGSGFLPYRWKQFNEGPLIYLLGIGSPSHPLPAASWAAWQRGPLCTYGGYTFMCCPPLFTHQYMQAWFNLRGLRDHFADYFRDSRYATLANRELCISLGKRFSDYGPDAWGITASDSASGYRAWGGPPATPGINGTLVPCAAGGSIPFAPRQCVADLRRLKKKYSSMHIYGRYGFVDAFNPLTGWVDKDVLGIDQGITLIMAENYRTGFVWKTFMADPVAQRALRRAGFRKMTATAKLPKNTSVFRR